MKGDDDAIFIHEFKQGNEKAFDRLFAKYRMPVYSLCYRYTRNRADALEVTQDVFIKAYHHLKGFKERSKFFTWLYRIAVNTCVSFTRKQKRTERISDTTSSDSSLQQVRLKIAIDDAIKRLPKRQRLCFILHHYDGYTFDEVGQIMRITTGAAKAHHFQAIRKLRVFLKDWV